VGKLWLPLHLETAHNNTIQQVLAKAFSTKHFQTTSFNTFQ